MWLLNLVLLRVLFLLNHQVVAATLPMQAVFSGGFGTLVVLP